MPGKQSIPSDRLLAMYRTMVTIRTFETREAQVYRQGLLNSLAIGTSVTLLTGLIAVPLALISHRFDYTLKRLLAALVRAESAFDPNAVSRAGACGLTQLMPAAASDHRVVDPFDPEENIRGGVREISRLVDRYAGNLQLALAAYNAGEGAVMRNGGVPPFAETRGYVPKVLAAFTVARALCKTQPELITDVGRDPRHYKEVDRTTGFSTESMVAVPLPGCDPQLSGLASSPVTRQPSGMPSLSQSLVSHSSGVPSLSQSFSQPSPDTSFPSSQSGPSMPT